MARKFGAGAIDVLASEPHLYVAVLISVAKRRCVGGQHINPAWLLRIMHEQRLSCVFTEAVSDPNGRHFRKNVSGSTWFRNNRVLVSAPELRKPEPHKRLAIRSTGLSPTNGSWDSGYKPAPSVPTHTEDAGLSAQKTKRYDLSRSGGASNIVTLRTTQC